jgi:hypothetical protein
MTDIRHDTPMPANGPTKDAAVASTSRKHEADQAGNGTPAANGRAALQTMGSCTVTSLAPSGKVACSAGLDDLTPIESRLQSA